MKKNKVQILLMILCSIFFNAVYITCALKDDANTNIELIVSAQLSPAIQTPYWIVQNFFNNE